MAEADILELTINGQAFSNQIVNVLHFIQKSTGSGWKGPELLDDWIANLQTPWLAMIDGQYFIDVYRVTDVVPGLAARVEDFPTSGNVGTGGVATAPNTVAAVLSWSTARAGKSYHGRTYVAPVPGTFMARNSITVTGKAAYDAFIAAFIARYGPAGSSVDFQAAVVSRWTGGVERTQPIATPIVAGQVRAVLGTQRKRRLGVGG